MKKNYIGKSIQNIEQVYECLTLLFYNKYKAKQNLYFIKCSFVDINIVYF